MKYMWILFLCSYQLLVAQTDSIAKNQFLDGTWYMEGMEVFEHWDITENYEGYGFSGMQDSSGFRINEYLHLQFVDDNWIYYATVMNQNGGQTIEFPCVTHNSTSMCFENPDHDFPQRICYQSVDETHILVQISKIGEEPLSYQLIKK